jgi:VWFA-related protein
VVATIRRLLTVVLFGIVAAVALPRAQPQQTPVFTAGTTVVPVDVRVLDEKGQPVTNLSQDDFIVFENGVPQTVSFFVAHQLTADAGLAQARIGGRDSSATLSPQNRRVFLIVVGRGRLESISHGLQAASDFVRHQVLPQDEIAVMGWNRATNFSTDHARAAALIDRLKPEHEKIEAELTDWFSGLRGQYGPKEIPKAIQVHIDRVFDQPGAVTKVVDAPLVPNATQLDRDRQDALNAIMSTTPVPGGALLSGGLSLDEYVHQMSKADQDLSKLYSGIEFLRALDGEKHLVFITEGGIGLPRVEQDKDVAARAADARVAIDCIQTGGTSATSAVEPFDTLLFSTVNQFAVASLERFSELTGGTVSIYAPAAKGFAAIDRATSFQYLLGYSPARSIPDGAFRQIEVKVRRPGVSVAFRHGYFSTPRMALTERELMAYSRILTTANHPSRQDFKMTASATDVAGPPRAVDVTVTVDPARLNLTRADGRYVGSLDVAIFCSGQAEVTTWHQVSVELSEVDFRRSKPVTFVVRSPIDRIPRRVLAVVYDFGADVVSASYARER